MTGATFCTFCRAPEDVTGMKIVNNCDLSDGEPCPACRDYMEIEAKISGAKKVLDDLIIQRSKIRSRVNQNHDLLTRHVPMEIVCSIFQFCFPSDDLNVFDIDARNIRLGREIISGPLLFGSICKTWRNIAWGMETLWTVLRLFLDCCSDFDYDCNYRCHSSKYVQLAVEWMARAGLRLPLSIRISAGRCIAWSTDKNPAVAELLGFVNKKSKQWKNLDVEGPIQLFSRLQGSAPNLQALGIRYQRQYCFEDESHIFLTDTNSRLLHLRLVDCRFRSIQIEWKYLTRVCLSRPTLDECVELLQLAPGVVHYHLYEINDAWNSWKWPKLDEPILYETMEFLKINFNPNGERYSQGREIITLFDIFTFPNLKHLEFASGGAHCLGENNLSCAPVIAHIAKSSRSLISLALAIQHRGALPLTQCIIPILQMNPLLQDLEISIPTQWETREITWGDDSEVKEFQDNIKFLQLFASTSLTNDTETRFLPNLQSIKLIVKCGSMFGTGDCFWPLFAKMCGDISSDIHNPRRRPLKTLRVQIMDNLYKIESEEILSPLLQLREDGIVLEIRNQWDEDAFQKVMGP